MLGVGARAFIRRTFSSTTDATSRSFAATLLPRPVLRMPQVTRVRLTSTAFPRASRPTQAHAQGQQCRAFHRGPVVRSSMLPSKPNLSHTGGSSLPRGLALVTTRRPLSVYVLDTVRRAAVNTWVMNSPFVWPTSQGYTTASSNWRKRPRSAQGSSMGVGLGAVDLAGRREMGLIAASTQQARGFWTPRHLKNSGIPMFFQVFYGTLLMIGVGVLLFTAVSLSAGVAILFLLAYLGFRVASRRPGAVANALQQPMYERTQMGRMLRPLVELMAESSLFDGLREIRSHIEEDVIHAINNHKELSQRYGNDFLAVGHHKMSMQVVNGDKMVVLEFPVISTMPRELIVEVIAKQPRGHQEDVPDSSKWLYQSVTVRPNDSPPVDLTQAVGGGAGKHIIIDATARKKKTSETEL